MSINRRRVVDAFTLESAEFSRILQDEMVTPALITRLKLLACHAEVQLSEPELLRLQSTFEEAIFDPLPLLFPGAREFLLNLKQRNLKTCLVCNTGWFSSRAINGALERCNIAQFFDLFAYSDLVGSAKPSSKIFEFALSAAGCRPDEAIHIGDKLTTDIAGALNAGLAAIHFHVGGQCMNGTAPCASDYKEVWAILSSYLALTPKSD